MSVKWKLSPRLSEKEGEEEEEEEDDEPDVDTHSRREYQETLIYGRYTKDLGSFAREESSNLRRDIKAAHLESRRTGLRPYRGRTTSKCLGVLGALWRVTFGRVGEEWVFLAVLGSTTAVLSFLMDFGIDLTFHARGHLFRDLVSHPALQYLAWVSLPICLVLFAITFVHLLSPQAAGSGIPEMKTILKGVVLKEYLTFKTLVAKIVGIVATLGSGLPLGKEGPFVHIGCILANQLCKFFTAFKGIYEDDIQNTEMLAVACGVGVACALSSPVGGVLYSIEVTSVYFAVRNYWRAFFASICGSMVFQLLEVWFKGKETLTPLFKTYFNIEYPYDPKELFIFALLGVLCGFLGAFFVWFHRRYVNFMRRNKLMKFFQQKSRLSYPLLVILLHASLSFPLGLGQFFASELIMHHHLEDFYGNVTWSREEHNVHEFEVVESWLTPWTSIFVNLTLFIIITFVSVIVGSTLAVPNGIFIPLILIGSSVGRLVGEVTAATFPEGLGYGEHNYLITPGGYAVVAGAAMTGAATHTLSATVILCELTGQITHLIPILIATVIANAVAQPLQPSIYDSMIKLKKLPYIPVIATSTSDAHYIYVEDFMVRDIKYIWYGITFRQLRNILKEYKKFRSLPLVDSPDSMILLGSIHRSELLFALEEHLGKVRRLRLINERKYAEDKALEDEYLLNEEKDKEEERKKTKQWLIDIEEGKNRASSRSPSSSLPRMAATGGDEEDTVQTHKSATIPSFSTPASRSFSRALTTTSTATAVSTPSTVTQLPSVAVGSPIDDDRLQQRRSSRFEVTHLETPSKENESSATIPPSSKSVPDELKALQDDTSPQKSILKKTNSFNLPPSKSPQHTPYATVDGGDSKVRQRMEAVLGKAGLRRMDKNSDNFGSSKSASLPLERKAKMTPEEQRLWEEEELNKKVNFSKCHIDPAPFQLTERTSLMRVHSLFSMLGLSRAYVTSIGRIIGVVELKELRKAIEETNAGELLKVDSVAVATSKEEDAASTTRNPEINE